MTVRRRDHLGDDWLIGAGLYVYRIVTTDSFTCDAKGRLRDPLAGALAFSGGLVRRPDPLKFVGINLGREAGSAQAAVPGVQVRPLASAQRQGLADRNSLGSRTPPGDQVT